MKTIRTLAVLLALTINTEPAFSEACCTPWERSVKIIEKTEDFTTYAFRVRISNQAMCGERKAYAVFAAYDSDVVVRGRVEIHGIVPQDTTNAVLTGTGSLSNSVAKAVVRWSIEDVRSTSTH